MKRFFQKTSSVVLVTLMVSAAGVTTTHAHAAENPLNELDGGTSSSLMFGSNRTTSFGVVVGYSRTLMEMVQGSFRGYFTTAGGTSELGLLVGPTFDLALDNTGIRNAVFLRAVGGLAYTNAGSGTTAFAYNVGIGKRFELCTVISWDPEFSISGTTVANSNPVFALTPISFSFLF